MIKTIIVEDDPRYSERLIQLIKKTDNEVNVLSVNTNVEDALKAIEKNKPDLVFLDVELGPDTGFDLLREIEIITFDVIFTTNHINKYIRDIRACALTYLPKPVDLQELEEALKKFKNKNNYKTGQEQLTDLKANLQTKIAEEKKIWINDNDNNFFPICISSIIYCTSDNKLTTFFIKESGAGLPKTTIPAPDQKGIVKWVSLRGIGEWEDILEDFRFCRIHNRHIANLAHVVRYTRGEGGYVLMDTGVNLDVSKDRKVKFLKMSGMR